ncbi:dnaJ homolog subfamily C member 2 [Onthophagus taurus]|uniref:dnaJ homolog subfamily C member 2 n=1 Tax=Onthophagus taurus TaxID=166361 RepID=UPI000C2067C7|nr:dnaJ homolog subfamily C member 2 [Onthophagus taurus]
MCEVRLTEKCTTVALRYRFVFKRNENGDPTLEYLPHAVKKLEIPSTPPPEEEQKEEEVEIEEVDVKYLRSLDPKEWKKQDHYKVLGLENARIKASDEIIKTAYRKMVLKHHPDKRKAQGEEIRTDDDYFTCITMAYETLGNSIKRRSYDSVDPEFDDSLPLQSDIKQDFFKTLSFYFDLNSRWCEKKHVPKLGDLDSPREKVEYFYSFWYDFKSWREYSYEDEEDKDKCQDREERRYVDKINKAERLRKKKEEMARIRSLVDLAYNADPRIAKFKQEDKDKKLAAKKARQTAAQQKKEEEEKLLREAKLAKEKAEAEEKAKIEAKRLEREAQKKALKKERKIFRDTCKSSNYFSEKESERINNMMAVDQICEVFSALELAELNKNLKNNGKQAFAKAMSESQARIEEEKKSVLETYTQKVTEQLQNTNIANPEWTNDNLQLLIKAVNLFPAGTNQRWDVVANFLNQHGTFTENTRKFNSKMVLAKAKDLQSTDFSKNNLKEAANKQAFDNLKKEKRNVVVTADESKKIDDEKIAINGGMTNGELKQVDKPWTTQEQQLLEQALKTYPASTQERWDKIADCVPGRTKKDCMKRYKELVEIIKAKKAAQTAGGATK